VTVRHLAVPYYRPVSVGVVTVAALANSNNDANPHQTNAVTAFTPAANSRVIVFAFAVTDGSNTYYDPQISTTITGWSSALARTGRSSNLAIGFNPVMCVFEGVMGASPSSGTITVDWHTDTSTAYGCFQVVGATGTLGIPSHKQTMATVKVEDDGGGNSETHTTSSLGSAATSGSTCLVAFGAQHDGVVASATPSGWTAVGTPQSANYATVGVWSKTDFTGTSVICTDLGTLVDSSGSALMELVSI
jgi:hypothetical protein